MGTLRPAKWVFAWLPVKAEDTSKLVWLRKVYREWWYRKMYFERPELSSKVKPHLFPESPQHHDKHCWCRNLQGEQGEEHNG